MANQYAKHLKPKKFPNSTLTVHALAVELTKGFKDNLGFSVIRLSTGQISEEKKILLALRPNQIFVSRESVDILKLTSMGVFCLFGFLWMCLGFAHCQRQATGVVGTQHLI